MGLFSLFNDNSRDVEEIKINKWLDTSQEYGIYLLTDSKPNRVARYLQDNGVYIYRASSNISKIGGKFVMDIEPSILLFIDTGKGLYSNTQSRKELIDVIGAGDLSMNKAVIVFYTDSSVKIEALRVLKNTESIKWLKYDGTYKVLEKLLSAEIKLVKSKDNYEDDFNGIKCKLEDSLIAEHSAVSEEKISNIQSCLDCVSTIVDIGNNENVECIPGFDIVI